MSLRLDRYDGAGQFLATAEPFLVAREAENNLILGLAGDLRRGARQYEAPPLLATVTDGRRMVAAALRTPPHNLLLSVTDDPDAVPVLAELLEADPPPAIGAWPPSGIATCSPRG